MVNEQQREDAGWSGLHQAISSAANTIGALTGVADEHVDWPTVGLDALHGRAHGLVVSDVAASIPDGALPPALQGQLLKGISG